ncbi:ATP-dependent DNA helicase PIF1-like [Aphis craccivora]|uniref:ATP-dependent DNA helicase PIF1-like n=1 Tax=Aphis craccivora TaxID=307492 RepID=A0A6G0ZBI1_APHCR|nr:ATP-dependent DNA helicase PIF1-like [Aphis craccivora]
MQDLKGNDKLFVHPNTRCIKLTDNFFTAVKRKNELILNFQIQPLLLGDLMSFKSIDTIVDKNKLNATTQSLVEDWFTNYSSAFCNGKRLIIKRITGNENCHITTYSTYIPGISSIIQNASISCSFSFCNVHKLVSKTNNVHLRLGLGKSIYIF